MQVIGFGLIILASAGFGYGKSQELSLHLKALENLRQVFYMLRSELEYTKATFEDVFERIGDKTDGPMGKWLKSLGKKLHNKEENTFFEIWVNSIDQELKDSYLKQDNLEELKEIGKNLGHFENIDLFIERLEYNIQNTRECYTTKGKLYKSFGIMGGVFLVILLL